MNTPSLSWAENVFSTLPLDARLCFLRGVSSSRTDDKCFTPLECFATETMLTAGRRAGTGTAVGTECFFWVFTDTANLWLSDADFLRATAAPPAPSSLLDQPLPSWRLCFAARHWILTVSRGICVCWCSMWPAALFSRSFDKAKAPEQLSECKTTPTWCCCVPETVIFLLLSKSHTR